MEGAGSWRGTEGAMGGRRRKGWTRGELGGQVRNEVKQGKEGKVLGEGRGGEGGSPCHPCKVMLKYLAENVIKLRPRLLKPGQEVFVWLSSGPGKRGIRAVAGREAEHRDATLKVTADCIPILELTLWQQNGGIGVKTGKESSEKATQTRNRGMHRQYDLVFPLPILIHPPCQYPFPISSPCIPRS